MLQGHIWKNLNTGNGWRMEVTDTMKLLPVSRVSFHIHESVIHPPKDCSPHFLKFLSLVVLYNSISVGIIGDIDVQRISVLKWRHQFHLGKEKSSFVWNHPLGCRTFNFSKSCSLNANNASRFENAPKKREVIDKQVEEIRIIYMTLN